MGISEFEMIDSKRKVKKGKNSFLAPSISGKTRSAMGKVKGNEAARRKANPVSKVHASYNKGTTE